MDFKDTIINIQKILCDLRTRIDNITNTPVTVTTGQGENYTYLDLTSSDTAVNTITLQTEIDRVANLTPYGLPLSDTNRFTIYATGKVDQIYVNNFINLCSPAGFLEVYALLTFNFFKSNDFINIKHLAYFGAESSDKLKIINSIFLDSFVMSASQNLIIQNINVAGVFGANTCTDLKLEGSSVAGNFNAQFSTNLKLEGSSFASNFRVSISQNISITTSKIDDVNAQFVNVEGLIYNTILNPANVALPLKMRGCLDLNNDVIPNN